MQSASNRILSAVRRSQRITLPLTAAVQPVWNEWRLHVITEQPDVDGMRVLLSPLVLNLPQRNKAKTLPPRKPQSNMSNAVGRADPERAINGLVQRRTLSQTALWQTPNQRLRQTPKVKLCSSGRALTSGLEHKPSVPQAMVMLQGSSDRLETDAKAIPNIMVKSLIMSKASITPLKTQWKKTAINNGH